MTDNQKIKISCFTIQGTGSFAVSLFSYYLYFLTQRRFGFDDKKNLVLAAALGLITAFAAWQGGRFAQRRGYFNGLKLGFVVMIFALLAGSQFDSVTGLIFSAGLMTIGGTCLWPALEALVSEGETAAGIQRSIGIYNISWAATNALGLFCGGLLVEKFGYKSIFYLPLALSVAMLAWTFALEKFSNKIPHAKISEKIFGPLDPNRPSPARAQAFLKMAWLANPSAYIAIQTLTAVLPGIAWKFHLSPMIFGFTCSLWGFVRLGVFVFLWQWAGWHYRFRWLATAFVILIASFATILLSPNFIWLVVAQIFFGAVIGLIYYSSLFYSMDAGDAKGEHGGIHEAAIGIGNFVGPGIGALSLQFLPQFQNSGAIAVSVLLICGFGGLIGIWKTAK